ncbi:MAG: hypothetical protein ACJAWV_003325 [Flammeovirgaceae bacterium]
MKGLETEHFLNSEPRNGFRFSHDDSEKNTDKKEFKKIHFFDLRITMYDLFEKGERNKEKRQGKNIVFGYSSFLLPLFSFLPFSAQKSLEK